MKRKKNCVDNKNVFEVISKSYPSGYHDYELNEDINLVPDGSVRLIAPNKIEYILPNDIIFVYVMGPYSMKRKLPRSRWYFWIQIENITLRDIVYKRHNLQKELN